MPKFRTILLLTAASVFLAAAALLGETTDLFLRLADGALRRSGASVEEMEDR